MNNIDPIVNVLVSQRDMAMNRWAEAAALLAKAQDEIKQLMAKIVELESQKKE